MKKLLSHSGRMAMTLIALTVAVRIGSAMWDYYTEDPWTRDAHVRADIVDIAPDVSGLVSAVMVHDNARVHQGDVLFRIDTQRYVLALRQAEAGVTESNATLQQAQHDLVRYRRLSVGNNVSRQVVDRAQTRVKNDQAAYQKALADRDLAQLNLDRCTVRASVNGIVANLDLHPGDYVSTGRPELALVNTDTMHVEGYFEETKLARIHLGDPVDIHLMGQSVELHGRVESVESAIEDRERTKGNNLLADVNPTFTWVRLAQRVPVRIRLAGVPSGVRLVVGLTATVAIHPTHG